MHIFSSQFSWRSYEILDELFVLQVHQYGIGNISFWNAWLAALNVHVSFARFPIADP